MTDTPDFIARKQFEIMKAKPVSERLEIWANMMGFVREMAIKRIKSRLGNDISHQQLMFEIIKESYGKELGPERMLELKQKMFNYSS